MRMLVESYYCELMQIYYSSTQPITELAIELSNLLSTTTQFCNGHQQSSAEITKAVAFGIVPRQIEIGPTQIEAVLSEYVLQRVAGLGLGGLPSICEDVTIRYKMDVVVNVG